MPEFKFHMQTYIDNSEYKFMWQKSIFSMPSGIWTSIWIFILRNVYLLTHGNAYSMSQADFPHYFTFFLITNYITAPVC